MLGNDHALPYALTEYAVKGVPHSKVMERPKRKLRVSHQLDAELVGSPASMPTNMMREVHREREAPLESQVVTWK